MSAFKPYKELSVRDPESEEGWFDLVDASGTVYAECINREEAIRFAECWNALRKIAFPEAHMLATEDYVKRLEQLRKDAVAQLQTSEVTQ